MQVSTGTIKLTVVLPNKLQEVKKGYSRVFYLVREHDGKIEKISIIQGYLITVFCWFILPFICSLPLYNNGSIHTYTNAL